MDDTTTDRRTVDTSAYLAGKQRSGKNTRHNRSESENDEIIVAGDHGVEVLKDDTGRLVEADAGP